MTEAVAYALLVLDVVVGAAIIFAVLCFAWWASKKSLRAIRRR